jgi:hypothetical protein
VYEFIFSPIRAKRPTHLNVPDFINWIMYGDEWKPRSYALCNVFQLTVTITVTLSVMSKQILPLTVVFGEPGSSVGIATDYGLDGPGIEFQWRRDFRTRPDQPWGPPSLLYNGYRFFPGVKAAGAWCWPPTLF